MDFKKVLFLLIEQKPNNLNKILLIKKKINKNRLYEERLNYINYLIFNMKSEWV